MIKFDGIARGVTYYFNVNWSPGSLCYLGVSCYESFSKSRTIAYFQVCDKCGAAFRSKKTLQKHTLKCSPKARTARNLLGAFNQAEELGLIEQITEVTLPSASKSTVPKRAKLPIKIKLKLSKTMSKGKATPKKQKEKGKTASTRGGAKKKGTQEVPLKQPQVCLEKLAVEDLDLKNVLLAVKEPLKGKGAKRGRPPGAKEKTVTLGDMELCVDDIKEEPLDIELSGEEAGEAMLDLDLGASPQNGEACEAVENKEDENVTGESENMAENGADLKGEDAVAIENNLDYCVTVNETTEDLNFSSQDSLPSLEDCGESVDNAQENGIANEVGKEAVDDCQSVVKSTSQPNDVTVDIVENSPTAEELTAKTCSVNIVPDDISLSENGDMNENSDGCGIAASAMKGDENND